MFSFSVLRFMRKSDILKGSSLNHKYRGYAPSTSNRSFSFYEDISATPLLLESLGHLAEGTRTTPLLSRFDSFHVM